VCASGGTATRFRGFSLSRVPCLQRRFRETDIFAGFCTSASKNCAHSGVKVYLPARLADEPDIFVRQIAIAFHGMLALT
jgi:hypothetical protein